jgi:hypothetical protein
MPRCSNSRDAFAHGSQVDDTAVIAVERSVGERAAGRGEARDDGVRVARYIRQGGAFP